MEQTTFNLGPYLLGGFIGIIIGWVIGFFDSNLRSSKKIKQAEELSQIAIQDAKDKIAQAEAKASSAATPGTIDDSGLLRIKNENGVLTLDLDGTRVNPIALYPEQRKRLIDMLNVMRPWLENKPVPAPAPVTTTPPPLQPTPAPVNIASSPPQPIPPKLAQVEAPTPAPAPSPKKNDPPAAAPTMVGQINAILQTRIVNTKLASIGVTMIESPSGGVYVYVGLNKFEGIDAVPDEEVKSAIRAAIAEWERKYTPGLS